MPSKSAKAHIPCPVSLGDIFKIKTKEEATEFCTKYYNWFVSMRPDLPASECMRICKSNIGYFAGYGSPGQFSKVLSLFQASHPIFGGNYPTMKKAFQAGMKMGKELKKKRG